MLFAGGLVLMALIERLWFDLGPNIELVTMAAVLSGMYLPFRFRVLVPLVIMGVSDVVLGLSVISIFTWSGFVVVAMLPMVTARLFGSKLVSGSVAGFVGNLIFYLWTNFGVWATDSWGLYADDLSGLVSSYVGGLPFLRLSLVSTLLVVPVSILLVEEVKRWNEGKVSLKQTQSEELENG